MLRPVTDHLLGDAFGLNPTLTWTDLNNLGINDNGSRLVRLRAEYGPGSNATSKPTGLTIQNAPPF